MKNIHTHVMVHDFSAKLGKGSNHELPKICSRCGCSEAEAKKRKCPIGGM